jgi:hypothetical protein
MLPISDVLGSKAPIDNQFRTGRAQGRGNQLGGVEYNPGN